MGDIGKVGMLEIKGVRQFCPISCGVSFERVMNLHAVSSY